MTPMKTLTSLSLACALATFAACGSTPAPGPAPAATPAGAGKHVDPDTAGSVTGKATFKGTPPKAETIRMAADPACMAAGGANTSESAIVAADGSVANVFVYVKDALDGYAFDVPTAAAVLDQKGCRYVPHVLGVRVGQPVEFLNSDATLHNVHGMPMNNPEFNKGEPTQGMRIRQTFTKPEIMVPVKCNIHGWMNAYIGVVAHPYFTVTGPDGSFAIQGLPPGTYTVEAWHELYGTQSQQVTVTTKGAAAAAFTFAAK
jgi:plastocyanin